MLNVRIVGQSPSKLTLCTINLEKTSALRFPLQHDHYANRTLSVALLRANSTEECHNCCWLFGPMLWLFFLIYFPIHASVTHSPYMEKFCGSGYISQVNCSEGNEYRKSPSY